MNIHIVMSHKGGSGKTTISLAIIQQKLEERKNVLYISLDMFNPSLYQHIHQSPRLIELEIDWPNLRIKENHTSNKTSGGSSPPKLYVLDLYNSFKDRNNLIPIFLSMNYLFIIIINEAIKYIYKEGENRTEDIVIDIPPFIEPNIEFLAKLIGGIFSLRKQLNMKPNIKYNILYVIDSRVINNALNILTHVNNGKEIVSIYEIISEILYKIDRNIKELNDTIEKLRKNNESACQSFFIFNFHPSSDKIVNLRETKIGHQLPNIKSAYEKSETHNDGCRINDIKDFSNYENLISEIRNTLFQKCGLMKNS